MTLPIKLDSTSNGEFEPVPLPSAARLAVAKARDDIAAAAHRVAMPRRRYLASLLGAAATLASMNRVFAAAGSRGGSFEIPREAPFELAAAEAAIGSRDEFIVDVQLHHVNPKGPWRSRGGWENALRNFPNARCGKDDAIECFSSGALLKDVFHDSDTAMGVLSHVPGANADNPLDFEAAGATREAALALDGTERLLLHGRCMPTLPGEIESMDAQAARHKLSAFKTYTQFGPPGGAEGFFLDDDDRGAAFIERARRLGVRNVAVHKGFAFGPRGHRYSLARDIGPAAKRYPDVNFLVYHAGFDTAVREGPYDPNAQAGIDVLIRSVRESGNPPNAYAELGSTWRFLMRDPDQAAHALGKLLVAFGPDRILWGTDSVWYGSPQDQIQAMRAFRISPEFRERFGYPELTPEIKRRLFGLNAAKVYGLQPEAMRRKLSRDRVQKSKLEYLNDPRPGFATYGPRTRAEFVRFRALVGDQP